jgi:hypothetical protein
VIALGYHSYRIIVWKQKLFRLRAPVGDIFRSATPRAIRLRPPRRTVRTTWPRVSHVTPTMGYDFVQIHRSQVLPTLGCL